MRELDLKEVALIRSIFMDKSGFLPPEQAMKTFIALDDTLKIFNALAASQDEGGIYSAPAAAGRRAC